jgi:hypothetical protein
MTWTFMRGSRVSFRPEVRLSETLGRKRSKVKCLLPLGLMHGGYCARSRLVGMLRTG